jgi:hypothetical protein
VGKDAGRYAFGANNPHINRKVIIDGTIYFEFRKDVFERQQDYIRALVRLIQKNVSVKEAISVGLPVKLAIVDYFIVHLEDKLFRKET